MLVNPTFRGGYLTILLIMSVLGSNEFRSKRNDVILIRSCDHRC